MGYKGLGVWHVYSVQTLVPTVTMWFVVGLTVLATVASAIDLPTPKAKHLHNVGLEISLDHVPGIVFKDIKYVHGGKKHRGPFFKSADGKWYHRNSKVNHHKHEKPIDYQLVLEKAGQHISVNGALNLESRDLVAALGFPRKVRAKRMVFQDDFNGDFNPSGWDYEVSMYGGFNWEIQAYTNDKQNVFNKNGHLYLQPTLTVNDPRFGGNYLHDGVMDMAQIWGVCTHSERYGCHREGKYGLLPPVLSGKIMSKSTIRFGRVEVRAKIPHGDWIWPAIWMLPRSSAYGGWPRSGEIDIMESRGNDRASAGGVNHGVYEVSSTLHWGTDAGQNRYSMTHGEKRSGTKWSDSFHTYSLDWTEDHIIVQVDGQDVLNRPTPGEGYFRWGNLPGNNIWAGGARSAPFDKDFYLILNVAVGGTSGFFPDGWDYGAHRKPWNNNSPTEPQDFWNARSEWEPTWQGGSAMQFYLILNVAVGGTNGFFPDGWDYGAHKKPWNNNSPTEAQDFWNARSEWEPTWQGGSAMQVDYVKMWAY